MPNGFGFRGSSPPWPYGGRGRGGLPRCWYPRTAWHPEAGVASDYRQPAQAGQAFYPMYGAHWSTPYYEPASVPGTAPSAPQMTKEQELDFLKEQAEAIKYQLKQIETRIHDLGTEEEQG